MRMSKSLPDLEPLLYKPGEVAKLLGLSRTRTYEMIKAGEIPAILVAGMLRVRGKSLAKWIESRPHANDR
jgi:excisionase family DNA binding protein